MSDDDLESAFAALRETSDGRHDGAPETLSRVLFEARRRAEQRRRMVRRWLPLAAVLVGSSAWAAGGTRIADAVRTVVAPLGAPRMVEPAAARAPSKGAARPGHAALSPRSDAPADVPADPAAPPVDAAAPSSVAPLAAAAPDGAPPRAAEPALASPPAVTAAGPNSLAEPPAGEPAAPPSVASRAAPPAGAPNAAAPLALAPAAPAAGGRSRPGAAGASRTTDASPPPGRPLAAGPAPGAGGEVAPSPGAGPAARSSDGGKAAAPPAGAPSDDPVLRAETALFERAHRTHFAGGDAAGALAGWNDYLRHYPKGRFALEAGYNRGLALVRAGRRAEACAALGPYASGAAGGYRRREAVELVKALGCEPKGP